MSDLFLLSEDQMARMPPYFPLSHGVARVDDRRVISGIVTVIKYRLQWKEALLTRTATKYFITASLIGARWGGSIFAVLVRRRSKVSTYYD